MERATRGRILATIILLLPLLTQFPDAVNAQTAAHLTVSVTGQALVAGLNNTVTVTVANNYSGYIAIYDVDIAVSLPAPLVIIGDNHWHYDSIQYGQSVTVTFPVYAPSSAAGSSYQGTVTGTYKQLGDVSYTQESHSLGVSVTGYIGLVVYGIQFTPSTVNPGGNTTISGNVLNNGNLASYNANVTVESDSIVSGPQNSVFLGEVDPNIPRPFSILIVFNPNLTPGNYTVTVKVSVTDNNRPGIPIVGGAAGQVQVIRPSQTGGGRSQGFSLIALILTFLRNLFNTFFGSSFP